jgi:hypothetical protein
MRLGWFAAVAFVAIFGLGNLAIWIGESIRGPNWWASDLQLVLDAGSRMRSGQPLYEDPRFLYPPVAGVVGWPLALFDPLAISLVFAAIKVALAVIAVRVLTPGWPRADRLLAIVALVCSLPFLHDVMLGNANVLLVGAIAVAVFGPPTPRAGVLLGLAAAVFAKPLVVPVFLWLLVYRRSVLAGTVVAGLAATAVGVIVAGPLAYVDWASALVGGSRYAAPFPGNHGVTALVPALWLPVAAITAAGLLLVLARRGPRVGLVWAVTSGILLALYAGTHSALAIAVALPAIGPLAPVLSLVIVAISPIATTIPLPFYAAGILLASLTLPSREPVWTWISAGPSRHG